MNARTITAAFRNDGPRGPGAGQINWTMVGIAVTLLVQAVSVTAWAARAEGRITHLEAEVPAGAVARIDERTVGMEQRLARIERKLDKLGDVR